MPSFSFEVEYAKSGRAGCKQCKQKIDKDLLRVGFKADVPEDADGAAAHFGCSWHHFACFPKAKGQRWFKTHLTPEAAEHIAGIDAVKAEDQALLAELFKACRGEVPVPAAPAAAPAPAQEETPAKAGKKRKSKADAAGDVDSPAKAAKAAVSALTSEQSKAIEEAKAKLSSKNVAYLGAVLAKNGLPKAGRKEELVERVAENQVLGVPPTCTTCEKKKLNWSRDTDKFSCPGYFDDEVKAFKRCKGPADGAELKRAPWEEMA